MKRRDFLRNVVWSGATIGLDWNLLTRILYGRDLYPASKITWISHTQPGSGYDTIPRAMGPYMTKYLKELAPGCKGGDLIVKNEPAAAGLKAYTAVFRAEPDGYTIGGLDMSFVTDSVTGKVEFDVSKYTYLAKLDSTLKLVVTNKNGFKSWREAMEASKKTPLKISVGQFGRANHIAGILLKEALGLDIRFITTQSTSANMSMVMRGDVHAGIAAEESISNLLEAKEVRPLMTFFETNEYPGSVSLAELGYAEIGKNSSGHRFAIGPPGLPKEITDLLVEAIRKTMADKEFQDWARKGKFPFTPVYGDEAGDLARRYIQFYQNMEPMLKKYLL